jgi:subtilisin family serine protease
MTTIVRAVAPRANVVSIRMADLTPQVSGSMLGMSAAMFGYRAAIVNLSFGLKPGQVCAQCGMGAQNSAVLKNFVRGIGRIVTKPLIVAATGNGGLNTGFDTPARWWDASVIAVGSINSRRTRSSFSNYGTRDHLFHIVMPGGDGTPGHAEWVGQAKEKCSGTSVSTAYASAVLALYASHPAYRRLPGKPKFLDAVLSHCEPLPRHDPQQHGRGLLVFRP